MTFKLVRQQIDWKTYLYGYIYNKRETFLLDPFSCCCVLYHVSYSSHHGRAISVPSLVTPLFHFQELLGMNIRPLLELKNYCEEMPQHNQKPKSIFKSKKK